MTTEHVCRYVVGREPTHNGCYAARVAVHGMLHDKFLQWHNDHWIRPLTNKPYDREVLGWIGPLARTLSKIDLPRDEQSKPKPQEGSPHDHH